MIITTEVEIKISKRNKSIYEKKGYISNVGDTIMVKVSDLSMHSNKEVEVECDYCLKRIVKTYDSYNNSRKKVKKDSCSDKICMKKKKEDSCKEVYGVSHHMHRDEVKKKIEETNLGKYGVRNPFESSEIKKKIKETNLEKYGAENPFQSDEIKKKIKESNIKNNGVEYPMQSKEIQHKMFQTKMKNGKSNFRGIFPVINGICASKTQVELGAFLNGEINVYIEGKCVDIFLREKNVIIEYDGKGHDLGIRLGKIDKEIFYNKEKESQEKIISSGYKFVRISNKKDDNFSFEKIQEKIEEFLNSDKKFLLIDIIHL